MKPLYYLFASILFILNFPSEIFPQGNIGINNDNSSPDPSAMLDVKSPEKGILIPRMKTIDRDAIGSPANGLMIYNIDENAFNFFNGTSWIKITASTDDLWTRSGDHISNTNAGNVGIGTSNPTALLHAHGTAAGGGNVLFRGTCKDTPGDPPTSGSGTRLMWYPDKAAFRVGRVTDLSWDKDSIGHYSTATGFSTRAKGAASTSMGYNAVANGDYSISIGRSTNAKGANSLSMGYTTSALGDYSTSLGYTSTASGTRATALGWQTTASGETSTAIGWQTTASGDYSTTMGHNSSALSGYETTLGSWNTDYTPISTEGWSPSDRLFVIGNGLSSEARSNALTVLKNGNTGIGTSTPTALLHTRGTATGGGNVLLSGEYKTTNPGDPPITGEGTRLMWYPDKAAFRVGYVDGKQWNKDSTGLFSVATGLNTIAKGDYSVAMGGGTNAAAFLSVALGGSTTSKSPWEMVVGSWNTDYTPNSTTSWNANDRLFVIGNGTGSGSKSNALTVLKNGNTGIGTSVPSALLHTHGTGTGGGNVLHTGEYKATNPGEPPASGAGTRMMWYPDKAAFRAGYVTGLQWNRDSIGFYSIAMGNNTKAKADYSLAIGRESIASGSSSTAFGRETIASGDYSTAIGSSTIASGYYSLAIGSNTTALSGIETVIGRWNTIYTPNSTKGWDVDDRLFVVGNGTGSGSRSNAITVLKNGNTGIGTSTPSALLHTNGTATGGGNVLLSGEYKATNPGEPPASGAGTRMMWYPDKAAFRVGHVTGLQWNKDSIGYHSVAMGQNTTAKGDYSTAMGSSTSAPSGYEIVIGRWNATYAPISSDDWDAADRLFVIGNGTGNSSRSNAITVLKNGNTGMGTSTPSALLHTHGTATGGGNVLHEGEFKSTDPGNPPASFSGTRMMWYPDKAAFRAGRVTGFQWLKDSIGDYSFAIGFNTKAKGLYSIAMGFNTTASGSNSTSLGNNTTASGDHSIALGINSTASGDYSTAIGDSQTASGVHSIAMGNGAIASGWNSTAIGYALIAKSGYETVIGSLNTDYTPTSPIWHPDDRLFVVGNGSGSRSNALTLLKSGRLGLQSVTEPVFAFHLPNSADDGIGKARANAWTTYSDERLKSYMQPISYGLKEIMSLKPVSYFQHDSESADDRILIKETGANGIGFAAQEVYQIIPEVVSKPENELKELWGMSYDKLTPVLVKAMQEQQQIIESQQLEIEQLKVLVERQQTQIAIILKAVNIVEDQVFR